ncbi:MAG: hypothetical protein KDM81_15470, partial [Verrucomicrobiae bacterium]|nr:hypothetical protein [Verrucomicrobiae bacterium]
MLSLPLVVPVAGCRFIRTTAELPGRAVGAVTPGAPSESGVEPSVLQQDLMRFADSFSSRMIVGIERVLRDTTRLTTAEALRWNIAIDTGTSSIVTGPNPVANLLDLTAFVTVIRMTLEEYWQPQMLGESGQPLVDSARAAETAVWTL